MQMFRAVTGRWARYWHRPGFEVSYFACRLACVLSLALSVPWSLIGGHGDWMAGRPADQYKPVGVLCLFGPSPPAAAYFDACWVAMQVALVTAALGLFTRLSLLTAFWSFACLTSLRFSFDVAWSHGQVPQLLVALALAIGPPHTFTLDDLIRRVRGRPPLAAERSVSSGVLLGQFTVAWVFANAALYKLFLGNGEPLAWCYSDNLRNILILQHWVLAEPLPPMVQFLVDRPWAYKGAAVLNVLCQAGPLVAIFCSHRPILRAACGVLIIFEIVGLYVVMGLPNWAWCPLVAFFIDWDRLARLIGRRGPSSVSVHPSAEAGGVQSRAPRVRAGDLWLLVFCVAFLWVSLVHRTQRRYTFHSPLSPCTAP